MYFYYIGVSFPKVIFSYCWFCQVTRLQWLGSWGHSIDPLQRHFLFQAPFKVGGKKTAKVCPSVIANSLQPHGLQPTSLLCPWRFSRKEYWSGLPFPSPGNLPDPGIKPVSPFLHWQVDSLLLSHQEESESHSVMSDSLQPHGLDSPWESSGQNTGVGSLSLCQGIFPTQGSNPGLPHCRQIVYQLSQKGSPRILEWVAYPFPSRSSLPRNQTGVSCIAGRFFTSRTTRECLSTCLTLMCPSHVSLQRAIYKKMCLTHSMTHPFQQLS